MSADTAFASRTRLCTDERQEQIADARTPHPHVDLSGLAHDFGIASETLLGLTAIERAMLRRRGPSHLSIDFETSGHKGLAPIAGLSDIASTLAENCPEGGPSSALWLACAEVSLVN